jgi:lipoprotein-anchoring transpeptidase ErfK/SrfK
MIEGAVHMVPSKRTLSGAAMVLSLALVAATPASAQSLFFDWGFGETAGGSGKQTVAFRGGSPGEVIVSFGDRKLYYVTGNGTAIAYPVAIPREQSRWAGTTSVTEKRENPAWTPTPTMRAENPRLPSWVPGGHPMNPLGVRALYLGSSMYRIHGTDAPWTIGTAASKGCIRMYNQDVLDLYPRVRIGAKVTVTWNKFQSGPAVASAASDEPERKAPRKQVRVQQQKKAAAASAPGEE